MELRQFWPDLPSTQTEAVRQARAGAVGGVRVVAARQSSGRGRADHGWASPRGNLYLSVIVRRPANHPSLFPLAVGAELRARLCERYQVSTVLKWPNDLLVSGSGRPRKLAGILVDAVPSPTLGTAAVVGIGINVLAPAAEYPTDLRDRVVGLAELTSVPPELDEVEELAAAAVHSAAAHLASPAGVSRVLADCRAGLHGVGQRATVDATITGVIRTVGDDGELVLDTSSGSLAIRAGEVWVEGS